MAATSRPGPPSDRGQTPETGSGLSRRAFLHGAVTGIGALGFATSPLARGAFAAPPRSAVDSFDALVPAAWFDLSLHLVEHTAGYSPPVASRAFAYAGLALYEALVPGMSGHRSLAGHLAGLGGLPSAGRNTAYHWPTVANSALAEVFTALFPTAPDEQREAIATLEAGLDVTMTSASPPGIRSRSIERGRSVAGAIIDWSRSDGGHEGYLHNVDPGYTPPEGPGLWTPTPPGHLPALQPHWGDNRPFAVRSSADVPSGPHTPYAEEPGSPFHDEALEVYGAVDGLTDEQLAIARFWADDPGVTPTPPGHSIAILTQTLREIDASLDVTAEAYAKLGIAAADAFICCWDVKYTDNLLRPVTFIRDHLGAPDWEPPVITPPFPEHPSGHSVQSGAAATVLTQMFGEHAFVDRSHESRGLGSRSFHSFHHAADEAAISRLYGGIHFRPAIDLGLDQGHAIGHAVNRLPWHT